MGTGLPACQAAFLTLSLTDDQFAVMEPRRNGSFESLTLPALHARAVVAEVAEEPPADMQGWDVDEVALQAVTEIQFPALSDEGLGDWQVDEVALQPMTEIEELGALAGEPAESDNPDTEPSAGVGLLAVLADVEETCDEVATEDEFGVSNAGPVAWFDQSIEAPAEFGLGQNAEPTSEPDAAAEFESIADAQPTTDIPVLEFPATEPDPFDIEAELRQAGLVEQSPTAEALKQTLLGDPAAGARDELADELLGAMAALSDGPLQAGDSAGADKPPVCASPWPYPSDALQTIVKRADTLARSSSPVLVLGEPGSGSKLLAKRICEQGDRAQAAVVIADLSTIPLDAQGIELWGEEASQSGQRRAGFVELAQGGTLLIAGLEWMTPLVQSQLLTLMSRGDYLPAGAQDPIPADVRVLATASDTLLAELKAGRFNRPLFDLFGKGLLTIPALRNRQQDLFELLKAVWAFIQAESEHIQTLSVDAQSWLLAQGFTASVRDFELVLRRACLWTQGDEVSAETLKESIALLNVPDAVANCAQAIPPGFSLKDVVFSVTKHFIVQALAQSQYDLDQAAGLLGVADRDAVVSWMKRVDVSLPDSGKPLPGSDHLSARFDSLPLTEEPRPAVAGLAEADWSDETTGPGLEPAVHQASGLEQALAEVGNLPADSDGLTFDLA
jgi:DNA-binding NtrC family response regulator